jgi:hypothetical protein
VVLEELHAISDRELTQTIDILSHCRSIEYNDFKRDIKTAKLRLDDYFKIETGMEDQILIDQKIEPIIGFLKYIWPTLHKFSRSQTTAQHGVTFDLHSDNFMQRASGTIVVIDPLC